MHEIGSGWRVRVGTVGYLILMQDSGFRVQKNIRFARGPRGPFATKQQQRRGPCDKLARERPIQIAALYTETHDKGRRGPGNRGFGPQPAKWSCCSFSAAYSNLAGPIVAKLCCARSLHCEILPLQPCSMRNTFSLVRCTVWQQTIHVILHPRPEGSSSPKVGSLQ